MAETARKKNNPALAILVISLLVVMVLIAFVDADGRRRAADSGQTMPVDKGGDAAVMLQPDPGAPDPQRR